MKLGLHISDFTWSGGPTSLSEDLGRVARTAEDAGFDRVSVMDHVWQIGIIGPPEHEMLEAYTTLGYPRRTYVADPAPHSRNRRRLPRARDCWRRWSRRSTCCLAGGRCSA